MEIDVDYIIHDVKVLVNRDFEQENFQTKKEIKLVIYLGQNRLSNLAFLMNFVA